jgi:hypothetical protein
MSTHQRFKDALERIANGEDDPVAVAKDALRSRRLLSKQKQKIVRTPMEEIQRRARERSIAIFMQWIEQRRPTYKVFARNFGISQNNIRIKVYQGAKNIAFREKNHPLRQEAEQFLGCWFPEFEEDQNEEEAA